MYPLSNVGVFDDSPLLFQYYTNEQPTNFQIWTPVIPVIPRIGMYDHTHLFFKLTTKSQLGHMCDWRCCNYPLRTCSDKCGVIVLINVVLVALDHPLFQFLIGPYKKGQVYLQCPSQHAYYLRRILMRWFAKCRVEIN